MSALILCGCAIDIVLQVGTVVCVVVTLLC